MQTPRAVVLRHRQPQLERGAAIRILETDFRRHFEVLAGHGAIVTERRTASAARTEAREQVCKIHVVEGKLLTAGVPLRPFGWWSEFLPLRSRTERVIGGALLRVLERLVSLGN